MSKNMQNVRALTEFRLRGQAVKVGEVISKDEFSNKADWQNLCHMSPPRAEETGDPVGKPKEKGAKAPI